MGHLNSKMVQGLKMLSHDLKSGQAACYMSFPTSVLVHLLLSTLYFSNTKKWQNGLMYSIRSNCYIP